MAVTRHITLKKQVFDFINNLSLEEKKCLTNKRLYDAFPGEKKTTVRRCVNFWRSQFDPTVIEIAPPEPKKKRSHRKKPPATPSKKDQLKSEPADIEIEVSSDYKISEISEESMKKQLLYVLNSKGTLMKERIQCINIGVGLLDKQKALHQESNPFNDIPTEELEAILSVIPGMDNSEEEKAEQAMWEEMENE